MLNLGNVQSGSTTPLYFPFVTSNKTGSATSFSDALETNDFRIYKDGGVTERASQNGYSITSAFDGLAGTYMFSVDISDNTTAGFYQSGSQFHILLSPDTETIDGETVRQWIGTFTIIGDPAQSRISGSILAVSSSVSLVYTDTTAILADTSVIGTPTSSIADDLAAVSSSVVSILADTTVIGSPAGASIAADIASVKTDTGTTLPNTLGSPVGASLSADISVVAASASFASQSAASADVKLGTPAGASVSADIASVKTDTGTTIPNTLGTPTSSIADDLAAVSASVVVIDANVDLILVDTGTTLDGKLNTIDANVDLILEDTGTSLPTTLGTPVGASLSADISVVAASASFASQSAASTDVKLGTPTGADIATDIQNILTTALTETYGTDGSTLTAAQLLYMIYGLIGEFSVSGTTVTVKKLDGSTTAATFTINSSTDPTNITRAS